MPLQVSQSKAHGTMSDRAYACITLRDYDVIVLDDETTITVWRHGSRSRLFIDAPSGTRIQRIKREITTSARKPETPQGGGKDN